MNGAHPVGRCSALVACVLACSGAARAQTDEIQVYDAEIAAPGRFNLTWHNNFTPSGRRRAAFPQGVIPDRKSTRLNSSHDQISYAVFCLKKKTEQIAHC